MNSTIKNALNKYELREHNIENQAMALMLISLNDNGLYRDLELNKNLKQYLRSLKGMKSCEVQYATS